jgi:hypothetical protein
MDWLVWLMVLNARHFQQYFSCIVAVSFTGGGNWRKVISHWQTLSQCCIKYTSPGVGFKLINLVVIGTDCTGSCRSSHRTITATTAPPPTPMRKIYNLLNQENWPPLLNWNIVESDVIMNDQKVSVFYILVCCCGCDRTVTGSTTTCAISAYHHLCYEFESRSWRGVLNTTLCNKVCRWLVTGRWLNTITLSPILVIGRFLTCNQITE